MTTSWNPDDRLKEQIARRLMSDCTDCAKHRELLLVHLSKLEEKDAEIERLRGHIKHIGNDALRAEYQILLKEMRYIAGISTGQVKRVADAALGSLAQPTEPVETPEYNKMLSRAILEFLPAKGKS